MSAQNTRESSSHVGIIISDYVPTNDMFTSCYCEARVGEKTCNARPSTMMHRYVASVGGPPATGIPWFVCAVHAVGVLKVSDDHNI